ncbi:DNA polymerase IV [Pirellula sp. SH-Sr6A]|nr:DNA polymerase IV [Pirellula sp. SH-Sr6A]
MCIWLPNWPGQRASVAKSQADSGGEPTDSNARAPVGPILLFRRDPRRGNVVAFANQTARRRGVLPHMPLSQCGPLCPEALVQEYQPQQDLEVLVTLAEAAQCFSPIVGLEPIDSEVWAGRSLPEPQGLMLDITGIPDLFGGESRFGSWVRQWFRDRGFLTSLAIANSVGQAWGLANYMFRKSVQDRLLDWENRGSPLATVPDESDAAHEPWIAIAPAEETDTGMFARLPIESLRLDLVTTAKLHRLGIRTVGQLSALPRTALPSRFGDRLLQRLDSLLSGASETIRSLHPSPDLCVERIYEYSTPHRGDVEATIGEHLLHLSGQLKLLDQGALRVVCRVALERNAIELQGVDGDKQRCESSTSTPAGTASVLQISLYQPSYDREHLLWLMQMQLDSPAFQIGDVYWAKGVTTQITMAAPMTWKQPSLFDSDTVKHRDAIAKLVDQLSVRLGREQVVAPVVFSNPAPEWTYAWVPMTGWRRTGEEQETKRKLRRAPRRDYQSESPIAGPSPHHVWRRPSRLLGSPTPLQVTECDEKQLPAIVRYPMANTPVRSLQGPERIETGWWYGAMQQRDYYRLQLENGAWIWCYWDYRQKAWYLHGIFD